MRIDRLQYAIAQHRGVAFLCLSILTSSLGMGAISPILPLFIDQEYHVSRTQVGLAVGLFGIGRIFTSLPAGYLSQRYGRRFVLIAGTAINLLGASMVAFSFSYAWLVVSRIISGLGSTMLTTGASVYLSDVSTPETRARFLSLHELSILIGASIGPLAGGVLAAQFGLRIPLFLQAALFLASLAIIVVYVPESRRPTTGRYRGTTEAGMGRPRSNRGGPTPPGAYRRLLLSSGFIFVGLLSLMIVANRQGGRMTIMPLYGEAKGFGPAQLGIFISVTHIPQFFSTLAAGFLSDRFGRKFTILPAAALICLGILVFVLGDTFLELMISGVLLGLGEGLAGPPLVAFFADIAPPGMEGITMGLFRTFGGVGSLVGAVLLGGIADLLGFAWSLGINALLLAASAVAVVLIVRETAGRRAGQSRLAS
ncbi:MAG: MFS transporter [Chloroflexi bacterium]|nr:MFS transporter [Chloroflexota bacterium]